MGKLGLQKEAKENWGMVERRSESIGAFVLASNDELRSAIANSDVRQQREIWGKRPKIR